MDAERARPFRSNWRTIVERLALLYATDAYRIPTPSTKGPQNASTAFGLKGRHVAGTEFLDALWQFGSWKHLVGVTLNLDDERTFREMVNATSPSARQGRKFQIVPLSKLQNEFLQDPPAPVIHFPNPPDAKFAWARRHVRPHAFSVTGVTHTICTESVMAMVREFVTGPLEPYDCLICTSEAARRSILTVSEHYANYLRDRFGGDPRLRMRLETIPLGVDVAKFRPTFDDERAKARKTFAVAPDEVTILFVGRLSFHSKAHPYPMYRAVAEAAARTGKKVHFLVCGRAVSEPIMDAYRTGARDFGGGGARITFVDGAHPEHPKLAWKAADIFLSLSDSPQETFGLALLEAQATGLPAIATDWDGYRDIIADGETGYLVPTMMLQDATNDATMKLLTGEMNYDHFLGECNQAVFIDDEVAINALAKLITDIPLRQRMAEKARQRVMERFKWEVVIRQYERLWAELNEERQRSALAASPPIGPTPECYPPPEVSFAAYPSSIWQVSEMIQIHPPGLERLAQLIDHPLTGYRTSLRVTNVDVIRKVLLGIMGVMSVDDLVQRFIEHGAGRVAARATVAWLLKYRIIEQDRG